MSSNHNVECTGFLIHSLVESLNKLNIFPQPILQATIAVINISDWYAIRNLTETLERIEQIVPIADPVYFQAGTQLANILNQEKSKQNSFAAQDWLNANIRTDITSEKLSEHNIASYCILQAHDIKAGAAIYECAGYLPIAYLKGYFYGSYSLSNLESVQVDSNPNRANVDMPSENFNIFVKYALNSQPAIQRIENQIQADYLNVISQLLKDSLHKQLENATLIARLNAELIEQRDRIARLANHDPVTGLASLRLGRDRLRMACNTAKRNNVKAAVMLIDLEGFKQANGQYGHVAGDFILKSVADRITKSIRATDSAVRQSGDSFLIILTMFSEIQSLSIVATRVINAISEPIEYEDIIFNIACNIGISIYPDDTDASEQMLKYADKALRTIKKLQKNRFAFYENAN